MPPTPMVVLEFDDNTPTNEPPFAYDVSMWSLEHDYKLRTRTAAETFRKLHEAAGGSKFRGYPVNTSRGTHALLEGFVDPGEVTWLSAAELQGERAWLPKGDSEVERGLHMLFDAMDVAARLFGADRVRLVFAFA